MVQLLTPSDSNSTAADTVRTMYVQMLDIYRKYKKYRNYRKNLIFMIFSDPAYWDLGQSPSCVCFFYAITRYLEPSGEHISVMLLNRSRCFAIKLYLG